ncbi:unnamed protein product [Prorocentrum cordatum]|uniref:Uncharacterized protein n=1 Tax=Prorocentrum cordatum TaxID=2364126 RepID=A0ABN9V026_9DINO|nr:unnamed protein product [Polarella glacialis]
MASPRSVTTTCKHFKGDATLVSTRVALHLRDMLPQFLHAIGRDTYIDRPQQHTHIPVDLLAEFPGRRWTSLPTPLRVRRTLETRPTVRGGGGSITDPNRSCQLFELHAGAAEAAAGVTRHAGAGRRARAPTGAAGGVFHSAARSARWGVPRLTLLPS